MQYFSIMQNKISLIIFLHTLAILSYSPDSRGEINGEIILFPMVDAIYRSDLANGSELDNDDYDYGVDIFATVNYKRLRFLGEYLLAKEEQELERIQLGWLFNENTVWLGRFHNPIGYWNTQFHHGAYLETSSGRPEITNFEDDSGLIPIHLAGLLVEGVHPLGDQGLGYAFALAAGPDFTSEGLEAWDPTSPRSGKHDISTTLNLYYEPVLYAPTKVGFFINYTEIPTQGIAFTDIQQLSTGLYGNWERLPWRLIGSSFYIHNRMDRASGSQDESFFHAYLHTEYSLNDNWILYGRIEGTLGDDNDAYLALSPGFVEDKILGGIRFDFAKQNALKLEVSGNHTSEDDFGQLVLQWSAIF